jgi:hypothetical protein
MTQGDVRIAAYDHDDGLAALAGGDTLCFYVCFHTAFVAGPRVVFPRAEIEVTNPRQKRTGLVKKSWPSLSRKSWPSLSRWSKSWPSLSRAEIEVRRLPDPHQNVPVKNM